MAGDFEATDQARGGSTGCRPDHGIGHPHDPLGPCRRSASQSQIAKSASVCCDFTHDWTPGLRRRALSRGHQTAGTRPFVCQSPLLLADPSRAMVDNNRFLALLAA